MTVALALHDQPAQKNQPAGFAHQLDHGVERLADAPRADELRRQVERHRMAGVERSELVRGGEQRDVDEREGDRAMDVIAEVAVLAFGDHSHRSEEHTSELQSLMRISYAVFCLKKKNTTK